jgi:hypothetical protein
MGPIQTFKRATEHFILEVYLKILVKRVCDRTLQNWPIDFHATTTFHHQRWQGNDSGESVPADSHGHILGVGFKAYY